MTRPSMSSERRDMRKKEGQAFVPSEGPAKQGHISHHVSSLSFPTNWVPREKCRNQQHASAAPRGSPSFRRARPRRYAWKEESRKGTMANGKVATNHKQTVKMEQKHIYLDLSDTKRIYKKTRRRVARKHSSSRRKSECELSVKCSVWTV